MGSEKKAPEATPPESNLSGTPLQLLNTPAVVYGEAEAARGTLSFNLSEMISHDGETFILTPPSRFFCPWQGHARYSSAKHEILYQNACMCCPMGGWQALVDGKVVGIARDYAVCWSLPCAHLWPDANSTNSLITVSSAEGKGRYSIRRRRGCLFAVSATCSLICGIPAQVISNAIAILSNRSFVVASEKIFSSNPNDEEHVGTVNLISRVKCYNGFPVRIPLKYSVILNSDKNKSGALSLGVIPLLFQGTPSPMPCFACHTRDATGVPLCDAGRFYDEKRLNLSQLLQTPNTSHPPSAQTGMSRAA